MREQLKKLEFENLCLKDEIKYWKKETRNGRLVVTFLTVTMAIIGLIQVFIGK